MTERAQPAPGWQFQPPSGPPAAVLPPGSSRRRLSRPWVFAVCVLALGVLLTAGWGTFVTLRVENRPPDHPRGAAWTNPDQGTTFRVLRVRQATSIDTGSDEPERPPAGAVYLVYDVQVTGLTRARARNDVVFCSFNLMGPRGAMWTTLDSPIPDGATTVCSKDDSGDGATLVKVFVVPAGRVGQVRGLQLDHSMGLRQPPLLTPPA